MTQAINEATAKPLAVAIMGPTASGKTAAALAIAQQIPCEIISVDSALVYRGMDIGTAKPTRAERAAAPHHLIDIIDPLDSYSVAQFRNDTLRLVDEIVARGKLPLLVGGTMLYFKGLADGLDDLPAPTRPCAPHWRTKRRATAGPPCTRAWRSRTRPPPPAWRPTTRSASSARWKSSR